MKFGAKIALAPKHQITISKARLALFNANMVQINALFSREGT